ncbi:MAG: cadherin-like beta sandwich domain-containing protein [Oscillospiraceae bacterium]|nr:cadherin-like beta sandwich domain-containing protein [Oscillospiraceae bacterium]
MKAKFPKILALILTAVMVFGVFPITMSAAEDLTMPEDPLLEGDNADLDGENTDLDGVLEADVCYLFDIEQPGGYVACLSEFDYVEPDNEPEDNLQLANADATLSSDATLKALYIDGLTMSPAFTPDVINYTMTLEYAVGTINIVAIPNDGNATVSGAGTTALIVGWNILRVTVIAEDGTENNYTLWLRRRADPDSGNANLLALMVQIMNNDGTSENVTLLPDFDPGVTSYTCTVPNSVDALMIITVVDDLEYATSSGAGAKLLSVGLNVFEIVVTAGNGITKTYAVAVTRENVNLSQVTSIKIGDANGPLPAMCSVSRCTVLQLCAIVNGGPGSLGVTIIWSISDASFATVDSSGRVTVMNKCGMVTLTATDPISGQSSAIVLRIT